MWYLKNRIISTLMFESSRSRNYIHNHVVDEEFCLDFLFFVLFCSNSCTTEYA